MEFEEHRKYAMRAFNEYESGGINVNTIRLCDIPNALPEANKNGENVVYILRLNPDIMFDPSVSSIPNRNDKNNILYIGGHHSTTGGSRYIQLIKKCRLAEEFFNINHYAHNDKDHGHPVAGSLTTSLLQTGFRINSCLIDIISVPEYNELEFIIGYQEKYHHLPPWNSNRKGKQGFKVEGEQ